MTSSSNAVPRYVSSSQGSSNELTAQYGDCFTFVLLGKKTTVYLGSAGNQFILNGSSKEMNAEDIYRPLTGPVFGKGVVYDCPNSKFMDQKRVWPSITAPYSNSDLLIC